MPTSSYMLVNPGTLKIPPDQILHTEILVLPYLILCFQARIDFQKNILFMLYDAIFICAETHLLFHPDMICYQLEAHTDMKNGILIYSVVVQNLACVCPLILLKSCLLDRSKISSLFLFG